MRKISKVKKNSIIMAIALVVFCLLGVISAFAANAPVKEETIETTVIATTVVETTEPTTITPTTIEPSTAVETEFITEAAEIEPVTEVVEIEEYIEEPEEEIVYEEISFGDYSPSDLQFQGVLYWGGWRWTWYSERVLPGGGLSIPGRHTETDTGFVCDGDGYICLASGSLSKGTVVDTPFGRLGKVYDCGCAADVLDVYVGW